MRILDTLRMLKVFVGLVRNPIRTELVFEAVSIASNYKSDDVARDTVELVMNKGEFKQRFEERYLPPWPTMEELRTSPEGSFGRSVYQHLVSNGLDLDLFPRFEPRDEIEYLNARAYQDHDLWHALLGYGTQIEDELALQAFSVAQFGAPLGSFIISGGILHLMIYEPRRAAGAVAKIAEGYKIGERAKFLLGMKLVDLLPRPVDEVRHLTGVA